MERVVITGMGIWSCLGTTLDEVRQSLYDGKSGIVKVRSVSTRDSVSPLTANIPIPNLGEAVYRP